MFWFESNIEPPESLYNQIYNVISNKCGSEHASVATSEIIRIIKIMWNASKKINEHRNII